MRRMTDGRESERAAEKATKAQSGASTSSSSSSSSPSSSRTGTTTTAAAGQGSSSSSSPLSKPPPVELSDFLKQQQRTAKGFVQRSDSTLDLLCTLAGDSPMLCRYYTEMGKEGSVKVDHLLYSVIFPLFLFLFIFIFSFFLFFFSLESLDFLSSRIPYTLYDFPKSFQCLGESF